MLFRVAMALVFLTGVVTAVRAVEPDAVTRGAIEACGRNLRSFERYWCEVAVSHGTAASLEDAKAGRYQFHAMGAFVTVVHGQQVKYERYGHERRHFGIQPPEQALTQREIYLTNGGFELHGIFGIVALDSTPVPGRSMVPAHASPLAMDELGFEFERAPYVMLRDTANYQFVSAGPAGAEGSGVAVQFRRTVVGLAGTWQFTLDPERGYLPSRIVRTPLSWRGARTSLPDKEVWLLDAKQFAGRYFPTRFLVVEYPQAIGDPLPVRLYAVTELTVDVTPTQDELSVELSPDSQVGLTDGTGGMVRSERLFPEFQRVSPNELHLLADRLHRLEPATPPNRAPRLIRLWFQRNWGLLTAAACVVGGILVLLQFFKSLRRVRPGGEAA